MHVADSEIGLLSHLLLIYLDYFCQMRKPVHAFYIIWVGLLVDFLIPSRPPMEPQIKLSLRN
jgi:hypothetical protein